jgi:TRAP-type C4-dicarboxylate transport system substrate-binding protein
LLRAAAVAAVGLGGAPALIGRARAATVKLRLSSTQADDPKFANGRVVYDKLVANLKRMGLDEQIEIAFFPNGQLGSDVDALNAMKLGVIDVSVGGSSVSANLVPLIGVFDVGYLFRSFEQQTRAFDAGATRPIEAALLAGANIRIIGWAYNFGSRSVLATKPVREPDDLRGLKIRTLPNQVITRCLRLMGAAATPMAMGEIYTALQAGVLDGLEHDAPTILASKFYETAKFYSLTQHNFSPLCIYMSNLSLGRMDPQLRDRFLEAAHATAVETRAYGLAAEKEALSILVDKGVSVVACDKEAFRKRVEVQGEEFSKEMPEARPIIEAIRATPG